MPEITNPDIFSITPIRGVFTFPNISAPFLTSDNAMSCGVVTITAPVNLSFWTNVNCISPVPGGKSNIKKSKFPQSVILATMGPLQITGESFPLKNPKDIIFILCFSNGTNLLLSVILGFSFIFNSIGKLGP